MPSADIDPSLRIVDLRAEIFARDHARLPVDLRHLAGSKIAQYTVSGEIGVLIRWNGGAAFALSVGGFFPKYHAAARATGCNKLTLEISPPIPWLKVRAEAYFAVTSNTVQFGGKVTLDADLEVAEAKAWIASTRSSSGRRALYFIFLIDAGVEIKALGETVAGVSFHGELSGMKPWHLEGHAKTKILMCDVPVDIGPIEWGEPDDRSRRLSPPRNLAAEALALPEAWTPQLPTGADTLARFRRTTPRRCSSIRSARWKSNNCACPSRPRSTALARAP